MNIKFIDSQKIYIYIYIIYRKSFVRDDGVNYLNLC